jgi:hypothetical protein
MHPPLPLTINLFEYSTPFIVFACKLLCKFPILRFFRLRILLGCSSSPPFVFQPFIILPEHLYLLTSVHEDVAVHTYALLILFGLCMQYGKNLLIASLLSFLLELV